MAADLLVFIRMLIFYTRFAWAGGTFFPVVLLCCVSFWFLWEKGFDLHTHVLLRVQYSCGGVLVIWFWQKKMFLVLRTYLVYDTVVLLCPFLVVAGNSSQNENMFI